VFKGVFLENVLVVQKAHSVQNVIKLEFNFKSRRDHHKTTTCWFMYLWPLKTCMSSMAINTYTLNSAKASINIDAVWIFPPIPKIYIHELVHFPVYLCLPFCTLFCGDQHKRPIHSPLRSLCEFVHLHLYICTTYNTIVLFVFFDQHQNKIEVVINSAQMYYVSTL
jgi:hypothetical protein